MSAPSHFKSEPGQNYDSIDISPSSGAISYLKVTIKIDQISDVWIKITRRLVTFRLERRYSSSPAVLPRFSHCKSLLPPSLRGRERFITEASQSRTSTWTMNLRSCTNPRNRNETLVLAHSSGGELGRIRVDGFAVLRVAKFPCHLCGRGSLASRPLDQYHNAHSIQRLITAKKGKHEIDGLGKT
jgi:hypothetical protein